MVALFIVFNVVMFSFLIVDVFYKKIQWRQKAKIRLVLACAIGLWGFSLIFLLDI